MHSSATNPTGDLRHREATRTPVVCIVDPQADDYRGWDSPAQAHGVLLRIVGCAEEALRVARSTVVDLWVVNVELPGLSGCELCSMLRSRSTSAPVYLVANEYSPVVERAALQARATLFGCKPGHDNWLGEWLEQRLHRSVQQPTAVARDANA